MLYPAFSYDLSNISEQSSIGTLPECLQTPRQQARSLRASDFVNVKIRTSSAPAATPEAALPGVCARPCYLFSFGSSQFNNPGLVL